MSDEIRETRLYIDQLFPVVYILQLFRLDPLKETMRSAFPVDAVDLGPILHIQDHRPAISRIVLPGHLRFNSRAISREH